MAFTLPIIPPSTWELYKKYWRKVALLDAPKHLIIFEKNSIMMFGYTNKIIEWTLETKTMGCIAAQSWNPSKCSSVIAIKLPNSLTDSNLSEIQSWIDWWRPETSLYFRSHIEGEGKCFIQTENWTWFAEIKAESKPPQPVIVEKNFCPFTIKPSRLDR